jgi:ubiquinone/menaquinone biosynthesis C-methylase UbiE
MATDAEAIKDQNIEDWDRAAAAWRKYDDSLRRGSEPLTRRLLELAAIHPGHRVLDIASGTGEPGLPAAELVGPSGFVLLTDQSAEMLAVARDKADAHGLTNVDFRVCDAEKLELEPESFAAALCRGALPLMPNPVAVLRVAYAALRSGGRIGLTLGGRLEANPYFTVPFTILRKYTSLPRFTPSVPLYTSDPEGVRAILTEAGFGDLQFEPVEHVPMEFESGREYWEYMRRFERTASVLAQIPVDQHDKIGEEVAALAAGGNPDGRVALKGESVVAAGMK